MQVKNILPLLLMALAGAPAHALGLADVTLHSHLGQPLRASIALIGADTEEMLRGCVKARVQTVDGGGVINASVATVRSGNGYALLVTTAQKVLEPAVTLTVEMTCDGRTQREYSLLIDPLEWAQPEAPRTPVTMPITQAPAAQGVTIPAGGLPSRAQAQRAPVAKAPARPAAPRPAPAPKAVPEKVEAVQADTAPAPKAAKPAAGAAATETRNVLRLSTAGDAPVSSADEETAVRLKAVQAKLLALETALASDKPAAKAAPADPATFSGSIDDTEQKLKEVQARIRALQIETKNVSAQELPQTKRVIPKPTPAAAVPAPAAQPDSMLQTALIALLAVAVAALGALAWRRRQMKKYRDALDSF